jgi:hypothetical protein
MTCLGWHSPQHGRTETGALAKDSNLHTQKFHALTCSLLQACKFKKSPGSASNANFDSELPRERQHLQGMMQDLPNKINCHSFSYSKKVLQSIRRERVPPHQRCQRPLRARDPWCVHVSDWNVSLGRLLGCQRFCKRSVQIIWESICVGMAWDVWTSAKPIYF